MGQTIALGAQHDGKFRLCGQRFVVLKPMARRRASPCPGQSAGVSPSWAQGT